MKKGTKILALVFLSLFLISFLAGIVSAQTVFDDLKNGISSFLQSNNLKAGTGFAQILMFCLITLIIYAIAEFLPFIGDNGLVAFLISAIIGFLSVFYLKNEEIYTILLSYSTLGIVLTSIIPFIVIAVMSKRLFDQGYSWMSRIIWIAFGVVLLVKWLPSSTAQIGQFGEWAYLLTFIGILIMVLFQNWIYFKIFKAVKGGDIDQAKRLLIQKTTTDYDEALEAYNKSVGKSTEADARKEVNRIANKLRTMRASAEPRDI